MDAAGSFSQAVQDLRLWLRQHPEWVQPKNSPDTNFFAPGWGSWRVPEGEAVRELFARQGGCVRAGAATMLMEKQTEESCLLVDLDYDFQAEQLPETVFDRRRCQRAVHALWRVLCELFEEGERVVFAVLGKPRPAEKAPGLWRDGLHILALARMSRAARRLVLAECARSRAFVTDVARDLPAGVVLAADAAPVDEQSASVPNLLYGAHKARPGAVPYELRLLVECELAPGQFFPEILPEPAPELRPHEFSLTSVRPGGCPRPPLRLRAAAASQAAALPAAREVATPAAEILAEHCISDPDLAYARDVLALFDPAQVRRGLWRKIVYGIASAGCKDPVGWEALARDFAERRHPHCRSGECLRQFPALWAQALAPPAGSGRITWASVLYFARLANPERYEELRNNNHEQRLLAMALEKSGMVSHDDAARILHSMFADRYVVRKSVGDRVTHLEWFEFCVPHRPAALQEPGDVWKYKNLGSEPDSLIREIRERFPALFRGADKRLGQRIDRADELEGKRLSFLRKRFRSSWAAVGNRAFVSGVLGFARHDFVDYNFGKLLDRDPRYYGVGNGILEVDGGRVELRTGYTGAPVSLFTPVAYRRDEMPPEHPARVRLREVLGQIFRARLGWLMKFTALLLRGGAKAHACFVMLEGSGNDGKSTFLELIRLCAGEYGYKAPIELITQPLPDASRPNPAYAGMAGKRAVYFSEPPKGAGQITINMGALKPLLSPEVQSTRNLFGQQLNFQFEGIMYLASNNPIGVTETNYGVWKRIVHCRCPTRFVAHPTRPNDLREDPTIVEQFIYEPEVQSAFLSELADHYEELHARYGGNIRLVPCPDLREDTIAYRRQHDFVHRFILENVVRVVDAERPAGAGPADFAESDTFFPLKELAGSYADWKQREGFGKQSELAQARAELKVSVLESQLVFNPYTQEDWVWGCRIAGAGHELGPGEEHFEHAMEAPIAAGRI